MPIVIEVDALPARRRIALVARTERLGVAPSGTETGGAG